MVVDRVQMPDQFQRHQPVLLCGRGSEPLAGQERVRRRAAGQPWEDGERKVAILRKVASIAANQLGALDRAIAAQARALKEDPSIADTRDELEAFESKHGRGTFWKRLANAQNFYGSLPKMPDADVLFDAAGNKLYVASHVFTKTSGAATSSSTKATRVTGCTSCSTGRS